MIRGTSMAGFKTILDAGNNFNKLVYSDIQSIELESTNIGISLKYVSAGVEYYEMDGKEYPVRSGQFLLVNHQRNVRVQIHSNKVVEGICLYVDPSSLADYWANTQSGNRQLLDDPFRGLNTPFHCREWVYPLAGSPLHRFIHSIHAQKQQEPPFTPDFYYELSKKIVDHQKGTCLAIHQIKADKKSTREELYRRLLMAKSFIHDSLGEKLLIRDVARAACLSEFHFMRSFKQAFGLTPNQYILQQRIQKAASLLRSRQYSISETAGLCGFSDHHYFSRCFKKIMGVPPSKFSVLH